MSHKAKIKALANLGFYLEILGKNPLPSTQIVGRIKFLRVAGLGVGVQISLLAVSRRVLNF